MGGLTTRAVDAQRCCDENRLRPKERKLKASARLHDAVNDGLTQKWSPKQVSRRLREDYPDDESMRVSHETVYECLYLQARGTLRTELKLTLRQGRTRRVNRSLPTVVRGDDSGHAEHQRAVEGGRGPCRARVLEGDLIIGKGNKSKIATLVERTIRFVMLVRIPYDRNAERVAYLLAKELEQLPEFLRNSVTWDQGVLSKTPEQDRRQGCDLRQRMPEMIDKRIFDKTQGKKMAKRADFTVRTGIPVYFCARTHRGSVGRTRTV